MIAALVMGGFFGFGLFIFTYAKGASYFSNDPAACTNCHVMQSQYDEWRHDSHREVTTCNDCHTPDGPVSKWLVKGINGWNHSVAFTTGRYPTHIQIRPFNAAIVQDNCVRCHEAVIRTIHEPGDPEARNCVDCHRSVGGHVL